jgi:hypothetical protein
MIVTSPLGSLRRTVDAHVSKEYERGVESR